MWGTRAAGAIALALVAAAPAAAAPAGSTVLVSRPDGFGPVPPAFDNDSSAPQAVSDDGRYVLFLSQADGFAAGGDPFVENLLLRDTQTGTTMLVNRSDGADGAGSNAGVDEADLAVATIGGQPHVLVVFSTRATNLVDHATGTVQGEAGRSFVWVRDVTAAETTLVSRADGPTGARANFGAQGAAITNTAGGPVVAFQASATNFGVNGTNGVFLRRLATHDTELVSCSGGSCAGTPTAVAGQQPDIEAVAAESGDPICPSATYSQCTVVAFATSNATLTGDAGGIQQIVMAITETAKPTAYKVISLPDQVVAPVANENAHSPSFSGDGRAVAFLSSASNLALDSFSPGPEQAFVRQPGKLPNPRTFLLSKAAQRADGRVHSVALGGTQDALRATFQTNATNLGGRVGQAYVRDVAAGTTSLLNRAPGPAGEEGTGFSDFTTAISGDGGTAAFASRSTNLGDGESGRFQRVRVRRLTTPGQEVELVSRPSGSAPFKSLTDRVLNVASSADGRFVAFGSQSASLSDADVDGTFQVYVRDVLIGSTILASRGDGPSGAVAAFATLDGISDDGRRVVLSAADLTPDSPAGVTQVYVRDVVAGTTELVSRVNGPTGAPAPVFAGGGTISRDGRRVAFVTRAALDPAGADGKQHVYLRDLAAGTTALADRGPDGSVAPHDAFELALDGDGSHVAWVSGAAYAGAPADGHLHVFLRDLDAQTTTLVSRADGAGGASADQDSRSPALDADGSVAAFDSGADNLDGPVPNSQVFVRDLGATDTQLVSREGAAGPVSASAGFASLDASGTRVVFYAAGNLDTTVLPPPSFATRVFLRDVPAKVTTLVSRGDGTAGPPANATSTFFSDISSNGDCVAFNSASTNLVAEFGSADFEATYLRVLRNQCPVPLPAPGPVPGAAAPPPVPAERPSLSRLRMSPSRFRTTGRRRGTTISFRLNRAVRVTLTFERLLPGRRSGRRCVAGRRRGRRCTVVRGAGRLTMQGRAGANRRRFTGVLSKRRLRPGRYRLHATPAGGTRRTIAFRVLAPRR